MPGHPGQLTLTRLAVCCGKCIYYYVYFFHRHADLYIARIELKIGVLVAFVSVSEFVTNILHMSIISGFIWNSRSSPEFY